MNPTLGFVPGRGDPGDKLEPTNARAVTSGYVLRRWPPEFEWLTTKAQQTGFRQVESGPLARSSYHAWSRVA